jgi:bilirubin oxidase
MKLPAKADGGPHQPIAPNQTWQTKFDIIQNTSKTLE